MPRSSEPKIKFSTAAPGSNWSAFSLWPPPNPTIYSGEMVEVGRRGGGDINFGFLRYHNDRMINFDTNRGISVLEVTKSFLFVNVGKKL